MSFRLYEVTVWLRIAKLSGQPDFQSLGAEVDEIPALWMAAPLSTTHEYPPEVLQLFSDSLSVDTAVLPCTGATESHSDASNNEAI